MKRTGFKKKKRKVSLSSLRKKLWKLKSEFNRRKDADPDGMVKCISCPEVKHWKDFDAGHFRPGSLGLATWICDKNIHCQCFYCNKVLQGNAIPYEKALIARYGQEEVDAIYALKGVSMKLTASDYEEKIEEYKAKIAAMDALSK